LPFKINQLRRGACELPAFSDQQLRELTVGYNRRKIAEVRLHEHECSAETLSGMSVLMYAFSTPSIGFILINERKVSSKYHLNRIFTV